MSKANLNYLQIHPRILHHQEFCQRDTILLQNQKDQSPVAHEYYWHVSIPLILFLINFNITEHE